MSENIEKTGKSDQMSKSLCLALMMSLGKGPYPLPDVYTIAAAVIRRWREYGPLQETASTKTF